MERSNFSFVSLTLSIVTLCVAQFGSPTATARATAGDCWALMSAGAGPSLRPTGPQVPPQPTLLYPADGESFSHFPRHTVLIWERDPKALSYSIEIDCYHCCEGDKWCTDVGQQWRLVTGLTTQFYAFNFVGAQPGRWRVWAVAADGATGPKSEWRQFRYTK